MYWSTNDLCQPASWAKQSLRLQAHCSAPSLQLGILVTEGLPKVHYFQTLSLSSHTILATSLLSHISERGCCLIGGTVAWHACCLFLFLWFFTKWCHACFKKDTIPVRLLPQFLRFKLHLLLLLLWLLWLAGGSEVPVQALCEAISSSTTCQLCTAVFCLKFSTHVRFCQVILGPAKSCE